MKGAKRVTPWWVRGLYAVVLGVPLLVGGLFVRDPMPALIALQRAPLDLTLEREQLEGLELWRGGTGEGPTLVLVHGFGDSAGGWGQVIGPMARRHLLVVPNMPGHGRSLPAEPPLRFEALVQGLERVVDSVDGPVVLIGNSLGGFLSLRYAIDHPGRVQRVILINSGGLHYEPLTEQALMPTSREGLAAKNRAVMGEHAPSLPGFLADALIEHQADPRLVSLWDDLRGGEPRSLEGQLGAVQTPVHVIWGTGDGLLPYEGYGERFAQELPKADEHLLEGCAHAPQYSCAPELVLLLEQLLAEAP